MAYLCGLVMLLIPYCVGRGVLCLLYRGGKKEEITWADHMLTGWMIVIGLAEAAHLGAVMFGRSFSDCKTVFLAMLTAVTVLTGMIWVWDYQKNHKSNGKPGRKGKGEEQDGKWIGFLFGLSVLICGVCLAMGERIYLTGDQTVETVNTILATNSLYRVNPLTGNAYTAGMPLRIKILCLPTLYAILCDVSGLHPALVVWAVVPVVTLILGCISYSAVARVLFTDKSRTSIRFFLFLTLILLLVGDYAYGMDGFGLQYAGYRGLTLRNVVILPYLFSTSLRKKWILVCLCILAEACIVWTLYGLGMGVLITGVMLLLSIIQKKRIFRTGKEAQE